MVAGNVKPAYLLAGALVAGALLWRTVARPAETGKAIGGAAVDLAAGMLGGAVIGIGEGVGVPETNQTQCARDRAAGDTWAASFSCPAGEFLSWWWNK